MSKGARSISEIIFLTVCVLTLAAWMFIAPRLRSEDLPPAPGMATRTQLDTYKTALNMFEIDNGRLPTGAEGLQALLTRPAGMPNWKGYLEQKTEVRRDEWGHDYIYICPGLHNRGSYDLYSMGPDGIPETDDDIVNWR